MMKHGKTASDSYDLSEVECYNLEYISDSDMSEIIQWIHLVRRLQHKNLMIMKDAFLQDCCINLSYNITKYGTLETVLNKKCHQYGMGSESVISSIIYQICDGLMYLHYNMNIIHRGIWPGAVFLDGKGFVKLGKLNNCIQEDNETTKSTDFPIKYPHLIPWYSPELIEQEFYGYSFNSDIYSIGLLIAFIFTGRLPYNDCEPPLILLKKISLIDIPNLEVISDRSDASSSMQEFFNLCIIHNPRERPNVDTLMSHPWLQTRAHCSKSSWKKLIND